jgi:beta-lactamase regulating signal transducer with metallopeptidase domain
MSIGFSHYLLKCSIVALMTLLFREICFRKLDARYRLFIWLPLALSSVIPLDLFHIPLARHFNLLSGLEDFSPYLKGVYGLGIVFFLSTYFYKTIRISSLLKRNRKILVLDNFPQPVYISEKVENALVVRTFSGYKLYINPRYLADASLRNPILYHELGHIAQHAPLWSFVQTILLILNWYNPLFWYCSAKVSLDFECAADAWAIEKLGQDQSLTYAKTLIHLHGLAGIKNADNLSYANHFFKSRKEINQRLRSLSFEKKSDKMPIALMAILTFMLLISFTGFTSKAANNTNPAVLPPYQRPIITNN